VAFEHNQFVDAQAETFLLLAAGYGRGPTAVQVVCAQSPADLPAMLDAGHTPSATEFEVEGEAATRFAEVLLEPTSREVWRRLRTDARVRTLSVLGSLTNGFVSGDNSYFLRTRSEMAAAGYPTGWLVPTARNSRSLRGVRFTSQDIAAAEEHGAAHHVVVPDGGLLGCAAELPRWLADGARRGVPQRYKCRQRQPWWLVPGLATADVLFTYMSADEPRAAANLCGAVYTNTLHGLRTAPGIDSERLATAFYNSFTLLSTELEGRSYGGGVLKLEPSEMQRVAVPYQPAAVNSTLVGAVDNRLRAGDYHGAVTLVDRAMLIDGLGWPEHEVEILRDARQQLVRRRLGRARRVRHGPVD
jgi:hypothetical protein